MAPLGVYLQDWEIVGSFKWKEIKKCTTYNWRSPLWSLTRDEETLFTRSSI
jgi:hypothetical protein